MSSIIGEVAVDPPPDFADGPAHGIRLAHFNRMRVLTCLILVLSLCEKIHALDLNAEGKKALEGISKQLQRSKIIKVGPRLYNREVTPAMRPKTNDFWIGIVGDSSATGAASHPDFRATFMGLLDLATKNFPPKQPLVSPIRVMYTAEEFKEADHNGKAMELNIDSDFSQKIDTEEYSFGYQIGQILQISPDKLVIAAQDGTKVSSIFGQMLRLMAVGAPTLPPIILASYVANDICPKETFSDGVEAFRASYAKSIQEQFDQIASLPASGLGTRIFILQPLDLANVLANPDLLSQKVRIEGHKDVTCEELRSGKFGNDFTKLMQNTLRNECPGLFMMTNDPGRHLGLVRALQDVQTEVLREAVYKFNQRNLQIQMSLATSARDIQFSAGDLANDCFHPSPTGAGKIAVRLLAAELLNAK